MKFRFFAIASFLLAAGPLAAQENMGDPTVIVEVGDDGVVIERPSLWEVGFMRGPTILLYFIGAGDGFPHFTAMSDSESALDPDASADRVRNAIEDLFETISTDDEIIDAQWIEINGLQVHSSLAVRGSVAGRIQRRRLLLVHEGAPYILVWAHYEEHYPEVAELIERCVNTLKLGHGPGSIAAAR
jgi:hypothetical protein